MYWLWIFLPPPSFKPVTLSLPRSPLFKTPKQVIFNPIHILTLLPHFSLIIIINLLLSFQRQFFSIFITVSNNSVSMSRLASIEARFHRVETALGNMESDDVDVVSSSGSLSNSDGRHQIGLINVVRELEEKISLLYPTCKQQAATPRRLSIWQTPGSLVDKSWKPFKMYFLITK